jgi:hypothetical protein
MDSFTLDCRQLDKWDFVSQPPVPLRGPVPRRQLSPSEIDTLKATLRFGKNFSPTLGALDEIIGLDKKRVAAKLLAPAVAPSAPAAPSGTPAASPGFIRFSPSTELSVAGAPAFSAAAVVGVVGSFGLYISTTREIGFFTTAGVALDS